MALFLAALLHTFFVGIVALYSRQTNRRWDIFEDDEMRRYEGRGGILAVCFLRGDENLFPGVSRL